MEDHTRARTRASLARLVGRSVLLAWIASCSRVDPAPEATPLATAPGSDALTPPDDSPAQVRDPHYATLLLEESPARHRVHRRVYVPAVHGGRSVVLALASGAKVGFLDREFLETAPGEPSVLVGGVPRRLRVGSRLESTKRAVGMPIAGYLGADFLLEHPVIVDLDRRLLVRYPPGTSFPDLRDWHSVSADAVDGRLIIAVTLDGRRVRLLFDTGSPAIVVLGQRPKDNDRPAIAKDIDVRPLRGHFGTRHLEAGTYVREVSVMRVGTLPSVEALARRTEQAVDGRFGIGALAGRAFAVQGSRLFIERKPEDSR